METHKMTIWERVLYELFYRPPVRHMYPDKPDKYEKSKDALCSRFYITWDTSAVFRNFEVGLMLNRLEYPKTKDRPSYSFYQFTIGLGVIQVTLGMRGRR